MPFASGILTCPHCMEYRVIYDRNNIGSDAAFYMAHLLRDHPEIIEEAKAVIAKLTPEWDWRLAKKPEIPEEWEWITR